MNIDQPENRIDLENHCVNTIRGLCMDAVEKANSGHPGAPMGLAPAAYALWTHFLKHNPADPDWPDRDRFVLSGGHSSSLLYAMLHLTGYDLTLEDIKNFRQWGSKTPGHPEYGVTPGVETTTGPLGQGFANAAGMAAAERFMAASFNQPGFDIVDHYTYMICGDGDLMEGISYEAASLAGHWGLGRLVCIYDDNQISIEGRTDITFTEDVGKRFEACGWHVQKVEDGNDVGAIVKALEAARAETNKPSILCLRTHIAFGSPHKQDTADAHGSPLGMEEIRLTKQNLGCPADEDFCVTDQARLHFQEAVPRGKRLQAEWNELLAAYRKKHPDLADQWDLAVNGKMPEGWDADLPVFLPKDGPMATRAASGKALNALAGRVPTLMGGSADLAPSNKTFINGVPEFQKNAYNGRNIRFGVREHAMASIMSGMALHKGIRPYGGTFLVFADYMRPAIRLAALMKLPVIYVFTHDSLAVGEDGPTHQPVEQLPSLRMFDGMTVIRPADAAETLEAWRAAMMNVKGPTALILSRQKLPILDRTIYPPADNLHKGAYILKDAKDEPDIVLISTGSEVALCLQAEELLAKDGINARVVSMPCWTLFDKMGRDYQDLVLGSEETPRLVVEAAHHIGWFKYMNKRSNVIGVTGFGASAPGNVVLANYGFTVENVVKGAKALIA